MLKNFPFHTRSTGEQYRYINIIIVCWWQATRAGKAHLFT